MFSSPYTIEHHFLCLVFFVQALQEEGLVNLSHLHMSDHQERQRKFYQGQKAELKMSMANHCICPIDCIVTHEYL